MTEGDEISPRATKEEPTIEELALSEEVVESILPSPIETSGNDSDSQEGNSAQITAPELPIELVEGTPTIPEPVSEEAEQLLEEGLPTEEVPTADADLSREISDSPRDEVEPLNSQPETVIESVEEVPTMPEAVSEEAELLLEEELPTEEVPTADADLSREISDSPHNEVEHLNSQLEPAIGSVDISLSEPKSITAVEEEHASVEIETPSQEEYGNQTPETPPISPASEESLSESIQKDVKELVEEVPVLLTNREKEDNLAQSIEDRKSLIAYNPATSKYDPNQRAEKEKKKPIALFIAIVGLAVGLFLAFSSQTGNGSENANQHADTHAYINYHKYERYLTRPRSPPQPRLNPALRVRLWMPVPPQAPQLPRPDTIPNIPADGPDLLIPRQFLRNRQ